MNTFNILDAEIGEPDDGIRQLSVQEVYTETITFKNDNNRQAEKVFLRCLTEDGEREFKISEAWNDTRKGKKVQGLWVQLDKDKKLMANSTLAKLISYYELTSISEMKGKNITGYPDTEGYVVLTTYDMEETEESGIFKFDKKEEPIEFKFDEKDTDK